MTIFGIMFNILRQRLIGLGPKSDYYNRFSGFLSMIQSLGISLIIFENALFSLARKIILVRKRSRISGLAGRIGPKISTSESFAMPLFLSIHAQAEFSATSYFLL